MTSKCINQEQVRAVLTGFMPGEEILLGRYTLSRNLLGELVGYDYLRIGPYGTAVVALPKSSFLIAVGQKQSQSLLDTNSGEISLSASAMSEPSCIVVTSTVNEGIGGRSSNNSGSLDPIQSIPSELLLPVITWTGTGGIPRPCGDGLRLPEVTMVIPGRDDYSLSRGGHAYLSGCNFPPLEMGFSNFYLPDGTVDSVQIRIDEEGNWSTRWWSLPGEPLGEYRFEFVSSAGTYTKSFLVRESDLPRITFDCSFYQINDQIDVLLVGFKPGEDVVLATYSSAPGSERLTLIGFEFINIGMDGSMTFSRPRDPVYLLAVGKNAQLEVREDSSGNEIAVPVSASAYVNCTSLE
jgi:hypothetical protein